MPQRRLHRVERRFPQVPPVDSPHAVPYAKTWTGAFGRACGVLLQAIEEWPIDVPRSLMVGDKDADMEAARRAGVRGMKFEGGDLWEFLRSEIS